MVKIYIDPVYSKIYGLEDDDFKVLNEELSFHPDGYFFTPSYQNYKKYKDAKIPLSQYKKGLIHLSKSDISEYKSVVAELEHSYRWDGYVRLLTKDENCYKTHSGLIKKVKNTLKKLGRKVELKKNYSDIQDEIKIYDEELNEITLRDYQDEIVNVCKRKKRGIVQAPTGAGKTEIFVKLIADVDCPSVVVVNRTSLLGQLKEKLMSRLNLRESEINVVGADYKQYDEKNPITIGTFQSLMRPQYRYILENCKMIIFDEVHHVAANELGGISEKARNAVLKIGFSATAWREDGREMEMEAFIGPIIYEISISTLIKEGFLVRPHIYFVDVPHTGVPHGNLSYTALYKRLIENKERNSIIAKCAYEFSKRGKIVLISIMRLKHIKEITRELKEIDDIGLNVKIITGKDSTKEKIQTIKKMDKGDYDIVISTLFGEGVDIPNLGVLINARAVKSSIDALQQVGRGLRLAPNKENCVIIDFYDYIKNKSPDQKNDYFKKFSNRRMKIYKAELEFVVKRVSDVSKVFEEETG